MYACSLRHVLYIQMYLINLVNISKSLIKGLWRFWAMQLTCFVTTIIDATNLVHIKNFEDIWFEWNSGFVPSFDTNLLAEIEYTTTENNSQQITFFMEIILHIYGYTTYSSGSNVKLKCITHEMWLSFNLLRNRSWLNRAKIECFHQE